MRSRVALPTLAAAFLLAGCTATPAPDASTPQAPDASASPVYAVPDTDPAQAGIAVFTGTLPQSQASTAGPALLGEAFVVDGQCEGDAFAYRVMTADPADAGRTLLTGTVSCADPEQPFISSPGYRGPVQVAFLDTDAVTAAWVRVRNVDPAP